MNVFYENTSGPIRNRMSKDQQYPLNGLIQPHSSFSWLSISCFNFFIVQLKINRIHHRYFSTHQYTRFSYNSNSFKYVSVTDYKKEGISQQQIGQQDYLFSLRESIYI